jgi:hypothetical protein
MTEMQETGPAAAAVEFEKQRRTFSSGANWFYWIAGLSIVNSVVSLFQGDWSFIVGLGVTQVIDAIAAAIAEDASGGVGIIRIVALVVSISFAGLFAGFGWLANRGLGWAFLVGMVLYALDGLLFLLVQGWLSLGFHVFALVCIFKGYQSLRLLRQTAPPQPETAPEQLS